MEIGAVIGAAPRNQVRREEPTVGDVVVLLGGKTGRMAVAALQVPLKNIPLNLYPHAVQRFKRQRPPRTKNSTFIPSRRSNDTYQTL